MRFLDEACDMWLTNNAWFALDQLPTCNLRVPVAVQGGQLLRKRKDEMGEIWFFMKCK